MAIPITPLVASDRELPDYLPARMVNEFVYCPRLFFYEWIEGIFVESSDTVEGAAQHKRVDKEGKSVPNPENVAEADFTTTAMTLSAERLRVIAKMDLVEASGGVLTPVDYKRGRPRENKDGLELWPSDRVQLALQALVLRENGYQCEEGLVYYRTTRQRVRVVFDDTVMTEAEDAVAQAWALAQRGSIPPPLESSPKCVGCSLAPVCLPDEVRRLGLEYESEDSEQMALFPEGAIPKKRVAVETRLLVAPRADLKPVYLNSQGLRVGKSGGVLQVKEKDSLLQEIRMNEICQLNLMGNIQVSTQAIQALCEAEIPVTYFSQGGWFYGITMGMCTKNVFLRKAQFAAAESEWFCLSLARRLTAGKIRNQRTMMMRNHVEPDAVTLREMRKMAEKAEECEALPQLLGLEGTAARLYFASFDGLLKRENDDPGESQGDRDFFRMDFDGRNRRPPLDPVNALLSLGYSLLAKDFTVACYAVGFDPMVGFYHQPGLDAPRWHWI